MAWGFSAGPPRRSRSSRLALLVAWGVCLALIVLAVQPRIAHAAGSVTYEQRTYAVRIQHDGTVQVTEHWQVHFSGGPFHHAFLALYLAKTSGITFGQVRGEGVTSQQVSNTTDAEGNPMLQVAWDYPETSDATRTFDIPYTIQGAICIGTSLAWLDWHFLDGGSTNSFPVSTAEVRVTLPAPSDASSLTVNTYDDEGALQTATPDMQTVVVTGHGLTSNVPLEVEVAFPRAQIDATVPSPAWQTGATPPTLPTALGVSQPPGDSGPYNPNPGTGPGDSTSLPGIPFNPLTLVILPCLLPAGAIFLFLLLLVALRGGTGSGNRSPWYRGPWGGGPWGGGGGFGGGSFGDGGGSPGGGAGDAGGGGAGGGGGGGSSGFS